MVMLDEPSLGLAPVIVDDVFDVIHNINTVKKLPVILVEQNAYMALSISNRCYVLENGRIAHSGKSSELIQSDVIRAVAARESAVFVGRCADYILRENPRCVNVFLTADDADRIGRIRRRQGCTAEEARAMMERVDARRASYYNYYSSRTWGEAATYHLCVSTSPLGDEGTADFILEFAARKLNMKF